MDLVLNQLMELLPDAVVLLRTSSFSFQEEGRPFLLHAELMQQHASYVACAGVLDWDVMIRRLGWGPGKGIAGRYIRDELHPNEEAPSAAFTDFAVGFCRCALSVLLANP